jgi:iron(III) transport system substrate-binding protein
MQEAPKGNDRAQILAVAAGEADIAIANTYYLALMLSGKKGPEQKAAAKK